MTKYELHRLDSHPLAGKFYDLGCALDALLPADPRQTAILVKLSELNAETEALMNDPEFQVKMPTTAKVDSKSDNRTVNNTMRHQYRVLSDAEKANMQAIKDKGTEFFELVTGLPSTRETSLAKTKIEEAVMWAVKSITA